MKHPLCLAALALAGTACPMAQADWVLPAGANVRLGGGTATLGCASLDSGGTLALDGGALVNARDVALAPGAQLAVGSGRVELARQWTDNGGATVTTGTVARAASPGCPLPPGYPAGQLLPAVAPPAPRPVPVPVPPPPGGGGAGGGTPITAQVAIGTAATGGGAATALPPGCTVTSLAIDHVIPTGAPANARFPLGALRFAAEGCPGVVMQVRITYPPGALTGLALKKYGPHGTATPRQVGWFDPPGLQVSGDTVSYTVADGGDGDGDARAGHIADPFAPMLLGSGGAQPIPALGAWGGALLSALAALLGARRLRRPRRSTL